MQRTLSCCAAALCIALVSPASAQDNAPPVPVAQSSYHVPSFRNERLTVLRVYIPAGRTTDYHIHNHDQLCVVVEDYPPEAYSQALGEPPGQPRGAARGDVSFIAYHGREYTHRAVNPGTLPRHSVCAELNGADAFGLAAAERNVPGYVQVIDNGRLRAWRLVVEPGDTVPAISQGAPGLRIVVRGGEIAEILPSERERPMMLRMGDFYWQEAGSERAVRNIGRTAVEIIELELK